jgi:FKBP-type peptidyl-prolyl cis-trans isomerase FkpA
MKTILYFTILTLLSFAGCKKSDSIQCAFTPPATIATSAEISYLQNYFTTNNIQAIQHPSGVFYTITNQGTGASPTVCSNITVKYTGSLLGGAVFDSNTSVTGAKFALGSLIKGWQWVLPILKTGGTITLYIPPSLGYGSNPVRDNSGNIVIPGNSYLKFDIELLDVQ